MPSRSVLKTRSTERKSTAFLVCDANGGLSWQVEEFRLLDHSLNDLALPALGVLGRSCLLALHQIITDFTKRQDRAAYCVAVLGDDYGKNRFDRQNSGHPLRQASSAKMPAMWSLTARPLRARERSKVDVKTPRNPLKDVALLDGITRRRDLVNHRDLLSSLSDRLRRYSASRLLSSLRRRSVISMVRRAICLASSIEILRPLRLREVSRIRDSDGPGHFTIRFNNGVGQRPKNKDGWGHA